MDNGNNNGDNNNNDGNNNGGNNDGGNNNGGNNGGNNNGGNNGGNDNGGNNGGNNNGGNNNGGDNNGGDNNDNNNDDNAPTTTSQINIPASAPAGQIFITQPPQTATSFYKIAPGNLVTFGWNTSYVSIIEGSLTVSAFCNNGNRYPVGPSDGVIPPDATEVVWDPYAWQTAHPELPLPQDTCSLGIADARDFTARQRGGYLTPNTMLTFALYTPVAYTPLASGWSCSICNSGASTAAHPVTVSLVVTLLVCLLSGVRLLRYSHAAPAQAH